MSLKSFAAASALAVSMLATQVLAQAQARPAAEATSPFTYQEVMVPMRDGARMQTAIFRPRGAAGPLPLLLQRTPYGIRTEAPATMPANWAALAKDGYIFVQQSMRGRFKSDGAFTFSTAVRGQAVDEATDAYDTIAWLVRHVPGTGKVGMWGISYDGLAAGIALAKPHPALKAVSPQAAWTDYWVGDDLHRGGALRLSYATDWLYMLQHDKADNAAFAYDRYDTFDWFLRAGTAEGVDRGWLKGRVPMFTSLLDHPDHDSFYTRQRWTDGLGKTTVPTLNVAGYWDQEDPTGSWTIYRKQELNDPDHLNTIVAGPWKHGGWSQPGTTTLGRIPYGVPSARQFLEEVEAPFFAWWLHGTGARPAYEVKSFQSGSWGWKSYAQWPPTGSRATDLFLSEDGSLTFERPSGEGCRAYVSDPAHPVPFRPRPISPTYPAPEWSWWEAEDQRFVDGRPDVLTWTSAPLSADLTVTGAIAAELMASTSGTDADFVVKLIDVFPDDYEAVPASGKLGAYTQSLNGYQLPIAMEVRRGRYLESETTPQPLVPGKVVRWDVPLRDHDHLFRKGHRLMVQVQSSWFPVIDRNPQSFVANIGRAKAGDFVTATQRICAGSKVVLPVVR